MLRTVLRPAMRHRKCVDDRSGMSGRRPPCFAGGAVGIERGHRTMACFAELFHPHDRSHRVCTPPNPGCRKSHIAGGRGWGRGAEVSVTELVVIRHGESAGNAAASEAHAAGAEVIVVDRRDADVSLSPVGVQQARALGSGAASMDDGWAPDHRVVLALCPGSRDGGICPGPGACGGGCGGRTAAGSRVGGVVTCSLLVGVQIRFPLEAERRRWLGKFYHRPPGGESWADVALRLRVFLADLGRRPCRPWPCSSATMRGGAPCPLHL